MKQKIKQIAKNIFYQLIVVYAVLILLMALGLFGKYSLQLHIFAFIVGLFGLALSSANSRGEEVGRNLGKIHYLLFGLAILLIIMLRIIPYIGNSIPLGYDVGIYKYGIEHGLQNLDNWIISGGLEPGFLYLMKIFSFLFSTNFILTTLLVFFCVILGLGIYLAAKEFSDSKTALIALFIYAFSVVQFKTFALMYYKNIIGMCLMLFSIYFLKKSERTKNYIWLFVILGGLIGAIHRPSFYIFGLSFFFYAIISPYKNKSYDKQMLLKNILIGIAVLVVASLFYLGKFGIAISSMFEPVLQGFLQPGESAGTFIMFFNFQFSSLFYLPFVLIGLGYFLRKKDFNILVIWTVLNFAIVYFQFFFFNRFIIFLDLAFILMASVGFSLLIKNAKRLGFVILIVLLFSGGILAFNESINAKPLLNENELNAIKNLTATEPNAYVMSTISYYSPWVLGYSERNTISPGLFDYDDQNVSEWNVFWNSKNITEVKEFVNAYQKPIYVFIGQRQEDNLAQFPECFSLYYADSASENKIYNYTC